MTRARAEFGVVTLAALDLRRRPDHRSELRSQLLMGEVIRIVSASANRQWLEVENLDDGYRGWVRAWGFVECSRARSLRWRARAAGRVMLPYAEVRSDARGGILVSPVFWNARLIVGAARRGFRSAELPDGRRGVIASRAIRTRPGPGTSLEDRIRSLLGIPYLWGGRTPLGFDCSAFVQQLLGEQGVWLPRDARDQFAACGRVTASEARPGDLVFFGVPKRPPAHVGLVLGDGYYIHSRGRVRLSSVDPRNPLCDKELIPQLRGYGRPDPGPSRRLPTRSPRRKSA